MAGSASGAGPLPGSQTLSDIVFSLQHQVVEGAKDLSGVPFIR